MSTHENLTVHETAEYLRISVSKIYRLIHEPGFPAIRVTDRNYIIPRVALDKWIADRAKLTEGK